MPAAAAPARWRHDARRYAELIDRCQAAIVRGDAYQLCLTNRVDVDVHPDPASTLPRAARVEPEPPRRLRAVRRRRPAQRVARAVPHGRRRRHRLDEADQGHPPARGRPGAATPSCARELLDEREGARREPHDRRPHAQRPRAHRRARHGERAEPARRGELRARAPARQSPSRARLAASADRLDAVQAALPGRVDDGRAQAQRDEILDGSRSGPRGIYSGAFGYLGLDGAPTSRWSSASIVLDAGRRDASAPAAASPRSRCRRRRSRRPG